MVEPQDTDLADLEPTVEDEMVQLVAFDRAEHEADECPPEFHPLELVDVVPPRVHPDLVERHRVAVDVERDRMLLDRLQPELTEDRYEFGQRCPRSAEVHAEAPVVTLGVDRPSERRGDRARRTDQRGDLAEVGDGFDGPGASPVLGGRRACHQVEHPRRPRWARARR